VVYTRYTHVYHSRLWYNLYLSLLISSHRWCCQLKLRTLTDVADASRWKAPLTSRRGLLQYTRPVLRRWRGISTATPPFDCCSPRCDSWRSASTSYVALTSYTYIRKKRVKRRKTHTYRQSAASRQLNSYVVPYIKMSSTYL